MVGFCTCCIPVVLLDSHEIRVGLFFPNHPIPAPLLGAVGQALVGKIMGLPDPRPVPAPTSLPQADGPHDTLMWEQKMCGEQSL